MVAPVDLTVKEIVKRVNREEIFIRFLVNHCALKVRGDGPKPKQGVTPKLYRLNDVVRLIELLDNFKQED